MKRRHFITGFMGLAATTLVSRSPYPVFQDQPLDISHLLQDPPAYDPVIDREQPIVLSSMDDIDARDAQTMAVSQPATVNDNTTTNTTVKKTLAKSQNSTTVVNSKSVDFARDYHDDVFVSEQNQPLLHSVFLRLKNLQKTIGFGNFNIVSFDEALLYAKRFDKIGAFTQAELAFIDELFATDAANYGFMGQKVTTALTQSIKKSEAIKIPRSGHYLFKNDSLDYYDKLKADVGDSIILTSGIRSNVKQLYLFLAKTVRVKGNLSRASRSLAPPGYSYHGIGDFDVGRVGWGEKNFTDDFANTNEFKRMQDLGYIAIRYDHGNKLGVRFEPWHIKVV